MKNRYSGILVLSISADFKCLPLVFYFQIKTVNFIKKYSNIDLSRNPKIQVFSALTGFFLECYIKSCETTGVQIESAVKSDIIGGFAINLCANRKPIEANKVT